MVTAPVLSMPRPLNITRARCAEAKYRDYPGSGVVPMTWENYLSGYMWDFSNALNSFLSYIYIDMRYGNIIFKNPNAVYAVSGQTVVNVPDWGPFISAGVSFGELSFSPLGFRINIKGIEYNVPSTEVVVYDDVDAAEAGDVSTPMGKSYDCWQEAACYHTWPISGWTDWWDDEPWPLDVDVYISDYWDVTKAAYAVGDYDAHSVHALVEDSTPRLRSLWWWSNRGETRAHVCVDSAARYGDYIEIESSFAVIDTRSGAPSSIYINLDATSQGQISTAVEGWEYFSTTLIYRVYLHKFDNYPPTEAELASLGALLALGDHTGMSQLRLDSIITDENGEGSDEYTITGILAANCGVSTAIVIALDDILDYTGGNTFHVRWETECDPRQAVMKVEEQNQGIKYDIDGYCRIA